MIVVARLVYWEGVILLGGFFGVIVWRLFSGEISLDYLLYGDRRDRRKPSGYSAFFSSGRTQLLMATILTAGYYLLQVIHELGVSRPPVFFPARETANRGLFVNRSNVYEPKFISGSRDL
jgi:hypothetical protein